MMSHGATVRIAPAWHNRGRMPEREKEKVRDWFTRHAAAYTRNESQRSGPDLRRLLALLAPRPGERILDVGTAVGHTALAMAEAGARVTGVDLTLAMGAEFAANARARGVAGARFVAGDVEALPFPDRAFDAVTCRRAAHHFPRPARAFAEVARVLRPGGRAGFVDMTVPEDPGAGALFNALERARDPGHARALPPSEWRREVEAAGLRVETLELLPDRVPWEQWLSPESPGGAADLEARRLLAAVPSAARAVVAAGEDAGLLFLKTRIVLLARRTA